MAVVVLQVPAGEKLPQVLEAHGLDAGLAKSAFASGNGQYAIPLAAVRAGSGEQKIWYRNEKSRTASELARLFGIDPKELAELNSLSADYLAPRKYVLLGFVGSKENAVPVVAKTANAAAPARDSMVTVFKPDSIAGLPVPVGAGYFEVEYSPKHKLSKTGKMGLFKTLGGWYDRKYYALSNDVPVGSVVKVTNAGNGKYVYAKVVSGMPGLKEDRSLLLRLNDAGRAALDVWSEEDIIDVQIDD